MLESIEKVLSVLDKVEVSTEQKKILLSYLSEVQDEYDQLDFLVKRLKRDQRVNENFVQRTVTMLDESNAKLQETNDKLTVTVKKLKSSNRELERFAHIASHDLKTPLHNIIRFTGLLEQQVSFKEDPLVHEYFKFIKRGGHRMNNLIDDLLEYSKLSKKSISKEILNLNIVITDITFSIQTFLEERNAIVRIDEKLPTIKWNSSRIFLLIKNMMENGIKYNNSKTPCIDIYAEEINSEIFLCIKDNGIGVSEEYHQKIFMMFNRLHNHEEYSGTGVGLATCLRIVEEFNGDIQINSVEGKGSIFKIKLPKEIIFSDADLCTVMGQ